MPPHIGCVIMASGLGRRFGGNKLMADFGGEPMIAQILRATDGLFEKQIVVTRSEEAAAYCRSMGIDVLLHELPLRSDTVRLGLSAMRDTDGCLFTPADQPLLTLETVSALIRCFYEDSASIWRPACDGEPGSPVLFPQWAYDELLTLPQGKGGGYVAARHPDRVRTLPIRNPHELMDADTPEELARLLSIHLNATRKDDSHEL